jgi:hypothetical protein
VYVRLGARIPVLYSTSLPHITRVDIYTGIILEYDIVIGHYYGLFYAIYIISTRDHPLALYYLLYPTLCGYSSISTLLLWNS